MPARYWELRVAVPDGASEALTNFVWESGALGVVEEERPGDGAELRAFFPDTAVPDTLVARVDAYLGGLRALGFGGAAAARVTLLEDEGWADAWRVHFRPRPIGRTLLVTPPWESPPPDGRHVLVIEPGRAFGTGQHGSTAGCLVLLEDAIERERPRSALDLGTGSGILAIAAARLGVADVLAVDDDPDAVAAAAENAARNAVADRVRVLQADAVSFAVPPASLVVANLLAAFHRRLADRYARWVVPGGTLVLGGILDAEAADVERAVARSGFAPAHQCSLEGWTSLALRHAPLHDRA